jgi:hypothetical protein
MKYGLLEGLQEYTAYVLGQSKMPLIPYLDSGDWEKYLPKFEHQAEHFETNGCTAYGTLNQIETFYNAIFGIEPNYAERFTYLLAKIDPLRGAYPQVVYDAIREHGLLDQRNIGVPDTREDYAENDISKHQLVEGQRWLRTHDFRHEWLWNGPPKDSLEVLKYALKTSPIAISVTAWQKEGDVYVDGGRKNNHWCLCYKVDDKGIHVYDSYEQNKKVLALDHRIQMAKRIWVSRLTKSSMRRHISLLEKILIVLSMKKPTLLDVCKAHIGKDASPSDKAPDELGCAETVTEILKKVYPETPIITGTWTLWAYFSKSALWFPMLEPEPGCVVISPSGKGNGKFPGHAGFIMDDGTIASNDSYTGKFERNYTLDTWKERYQKKGGFPVYFYKRK